MKKNKFKKPLNRMKTIRNNNKNNKIKNWNNKIRIIKNYNNNSVI